jgi:hypothetical protein
LEVGESSIPGPKPLITSGETVPRSWGVNCEILLFSSLLLTLVCGRAEAQFATINALELASPGTPPASQTASVAGYYAPGVAVAIDPTDPAVTPAMIWQACAVAVGSATTGTAYPIGSAVRAISNH